MKELLHRIRTFGCTKGRAVARFLMLLCVLGVGAAQADSGSVVDCLSKLNPEARDQIMQAIAKQPGLAGNAAAIQAYIGVLGHESDFRNIPSTGTSKDCPGVPVSYGRGQVNYSAHRDTIHSAGYMNTKPTGNYCADLAAGGQWLIANPEKAQQLSAQIFAEALNKCGGNVGCALDRYCGGCDKNTAPYTELVAAKLQKLGTCGDGSGIFAYTPTDASGKPTGPTVIVRCPDLDLAEALNKANQYYLGQSLMVSRASYEAGEKMVREQMPTPRFDPFGPVEKALCLDVIEGYQQLIMSLLGKAGAVYNMLVAFVNKLLNLACQYVVAAINNVLNSICIPLPNLPGLPSLSGADRKACNGISLADFVSFGADSPRLMMNSNTPVQEYQKTIRGALRTPMSRGSRSPATKQ